MGINDKSWISQCIADSHAAIDSLAAQLDKVAEAVDLVVGTFERGCKFLTCGNGGSAAEAMHMSEEAVGRFRDNRISLPAVSLPSSASAVCSADPLLPHLRAAVCSPPCSAGARTTKPQWTAPPCSPF